MVKSPAKKDAAESHHEIPVEETHELHLEAAPEGEDASVETSEESNMIATVATVGVVGIGVALVEAALLPGVILGVVAMAAPKLAPKIGASLRPMFKSTLKGFVRLSQKTRELVAETHEHVQDIVAEVESEHLDAAAKEKATLQ
jgi:hypothetical protein